MIEKVYKMATGDDHIIERIIDDGNIHYNHMILNKDQGLPIHMSNANVYMTVVRGDLSISLNDEEAREYPAGTILNIPEGIKMNARNLYEDVLELIVVKAPAPVK